MIEDYEGPPGRPDQRANWGTSWGTVGSGGPNPPKSSFPENRGVGSNRGSQPALFAPGHRDPLGKRSSHFNESQIRTYQDSGHFKLERRLLRMTLSGPLAFANRRSRRRGLTRLLIRRLLAPPEGSLSRHPYLRFGSGNCVGNWKRSSTEVRLVVGSFRAAASASWVVQASGRPQCYRQIC